MAEIEFRAFNGEVFIYSGNLRDHNNQLDLFFAGFGLTYNRVNQFTGLYDSTRTDAFPHGKKIYEVDIVQVQSRSYGTYRAVVYYDKRQAGFVVGKPSEKNKQIMMPNKKWNRPHDPCNCDGAMFEGFTLLRVGLTGDPTNVPVTVVGDIHQHPHLLD